MIAIVTKYHGATNYKPSRVSARIAYPISPEDERTRVVLSYGLDKNGNVRPGEDLGMGTARDHQPAAERLADQAGLELLPGMFGELPGSGDYGAYVFLAKHREC